MSHERDSFKVHSENPSKRGKDFLLVAIIGLIVVGATVWLTINLLDQSQHHVDEIKNIRVDGPTQPKLADKKGESDLSVETQVNRDLNAEQLTLEHHEVTDRGMQYIGKLKRLKRLNLGFTRVSSEGLKYLVGLPIVDLNLCDTDVTNEGMKQISKLESLEYLSLCDTDIGDTGIVNLRDSRSLCDLHLSSTQITDRSMKELAEHHPPIWKLLLINTNVTDEGLKWVAKMQNLGTLHLDGTPMTVNGLKGFEHQGQLHKLTLVSCNISNDDLPKILKWCPHLDYLDLSRTRITDRGVENLARFKSLKTLMISKPSDVSDEAIEVLRSRMPKCNISRGAEI